jgi:mRNA-degrading endonuclease RelE of RelBE toxin-antitoxin system
VEIVFEKQAAKALRGIQRKTANAIMEAIRAIAAEPFARYANVERIKGIKDTFRLRRGDWRAVYAINRNSNMLTEQTVKTRGKAYK